MLATVQDSPGDAAGVLALEEEGFGLSLLEAEDLAVATDEQLTLQSFKKYMSTIYPNNSCVKTEQHPSHDREVTS